ncbi:MAG: TetR/AcrR family transcriptional regulator, partial [Bacteroidota bacterium]
MASKRDQILGQALSLFNEKGIGETSTHDIARAAGIAQGNLTYHFPKRWDLVEALYFELIRELDELFTELAPGSLSFQTLYQAQLAQARLQKKYRFLFLDFGRIKGQSPQILS